MSVTWQPAAEVETLFARTDFYNAIRKFFQARAVREVETSLLSAHGVTDPYIASFSTAGYRTGAAQKTPCYLQTSPEYAMKRLLAAGSGSIFQICKAFRDESPGRQHQPEFTMLEWYRVGFDHHQLMKEMDALLQIILKLPLSNTIIGLIR